MTTVKDALEFIRKNDALKQWSDYQILTLMNNAIQKNTMAWSVDEQGNLNGLIIGKKQGQNELYIVCAVLASRGLFKKFIGMFKQMFPDYRLTGYRRSKTVDFTRKVNLIERL